MRKKKVAQKVESQNSLSVCLGQKHLIKCRCILPQMKNMAKPIFHEFLVFSEIENGSVKSKFTQCNNCGIIHKVTDICTSEIMAGKELMSSIMTIEDIKASMNPKISMILERNNCDLPTWEHAKYIIENKRWGDMIVLSSENEGEEKIVKYARIVGESLVKIDSHIRRETIGG